MSKKKESSLFDELVESLDESIRYTRGELDLRTFVLPEPPEEPSPRDISDLRGKYRMSQSVFAWLLNVSPKTLQSWEQGIRSPSGAALRLLQLARAAPSLFWSLTEKADEAEVNVESAKETRRMAKKD